MNGKLDTYRTMDTAAKSQLDLILKVYDGAIGACREAAKHLREGDTTSARTLLERAQRFVTHLYTTLDQEQGEEIASHLGKLYAFLLNQINVATATKDLSICDDIVAILSELRRGWQGLKERESAPGAGDRAKAPKADSVQLVETA